MTQWEFLIDGFLDLLQPKEGIVLDNLISNTLKFIWSRQKARIEIGSLSGQASDLCHRLP